LNDGYERVGKGIGYLFMMAVANLLYNMIALWLAGMRLEKKTGT
jgi:membrane associated rhomboid family serine protease